MPIETRPDGCAATLSPLSGTYFASPERLLPDALRSQVRQLSEHPILSTLLDTVGGLLAVLNEHRQILSVNEALLEHFSVGSADGILGLRLGEALQCPHAKEMPGGCGTSRYCRTCGAAIVQAVALQHQRGAERYCSIEAGQNGAAHSLYLRVRASPLILDGHRLILVFIDDCTRQQQNALAARSFHHDLNNTLTCLLHASETVVEEARGELAGAAAEVRRLTDRVVRELELQRQLASTNLEELTPTKSTVTLNTLLDDLRSMATHHPSSARKRVVIEQPTEDFVFLTDPALVLRVLGNMAINALEATHQDGDVKIQAKAAPDHLIFRVWNETPIPPEIALRLFQRNFSTKGGMGRGLGTYAMKLVGERLLGGRVEFVSSAVEGTTFEFRLPL